MVYAGYRWREYQSDSALEQRIIGTWTSETRYDDGIVRTAIWKFPANGTISPDCFDKPPPDEAKREDAWCWWHVSNGLLVFTFDR